MKFLALICALILSSACTNKEVVAKRLSSLSSANGPAGTPAPGTVPGAGNGPQAMVFDKNPVAAGAPSAYSLSYAGGGISISPNSAINFDQYLVSRDITGTTNGFLENPTFKVTSDSKNSLQRAQPDAKGNWSFSSVGDPNHRLGQVMAYYWINRMGDVLSKVIAGGHYFKGKNVNVYSWCYSADAPGYPGINAYWAGASNGFACMSYYSLWESALDASVYVHEMGHANIDYATNSQIGGIGNNEGSCPTSSRNLCCLSADGCAGAINEGQADFHSDIVFKSGAIGEYFINSPSGFGGRNAEQNSSLTAAQQYARSAEIHSMGGVWAAAWWSLRKSIGGDAEKLFIAHIATLNVNDTFGSALTKLSMVNQQLFGARKIAADYAAQISQAFTAIHGITAH